MRYTWDPRKAERNIIDHQVDFADAIRIFEDNYALSQEDVRAEGEERYVVIGMDLMGRILTVVYTYRDDDIRIISARHATRRERRHYEQRR
jgi:uncharacterized DUF497 family protein